MKQKTCQLHTLIQTGISGNTRKKTFAPLITLSFLLISSRTVSSCFPVNLAPFPLILIPHSPNARVVPLVDPPVGIGIIPFWRFVHFTLRGDSCVRCRTKVRWTPEGAFDGAACKRSCENAEVSENIVQRGNSMDFCNVKALRIELIKLVWIYFHKCHHFARRVEDDEHRLDFVHTHTVVGTSTSYISTSKSSRSL